MVDTVLGGAIEFLQDFGFFDVILPFLLVFTIVFGILEKTKIFGTEKVGEKEFTKKNIDAMVAFVVAFFVIAAKEIVTSIKTSLPMVALILVAIISLLMLIGAFVSGKDEFDFFKLFSGLKGWFAGTFIVAIIAIFLNSFGLLEPVYEYFSGRGSAIFIVIVFVGILGGVVYFVFNSPTSSGGKE
jgi:hypothetical protein